MVVWFLCSLVRFIFTSFVTFEVSFFQIFVKFLLTERRKLVATLCRSLRPENGWYFLIFSQKLTLIASKMVAFAEVSAVLWLALTLRVVLAPTGHGCGTHIPPKNHFLSPLKFSRLFCPKAEYSLGSFYVPTGIFAILSIGSYIINPEIVSLK